jgi:hypothetical protein
MNLASSWMQTEKRRYKNRPWPRSTPPEAGRPAARLLTISSVAPLGRYSSMRQRAPIRSWRFYNFDTCTCINRRVRRELQGSDVADRAVLAVTTWTCNRKELSSNLGQDAAYPDRICRWSSVDNTSKRSRPYLSNSLFIKHPTISYCII